MKWTGMKRDSLLKLFFTFFKIGLFTFGGGFAMIPLMEREFVENNGWMDGEKFVDAISITQSVPGAVAINLSIFLGYNLAGVTGALVAAVGVALPSFIIILLIALGFKHFNQYPLVENLFRGIRPAVAGLIIYAGFKLSKDMNWSWYLFMIPILVVAGNFFFDINPLILISLAIITGIVNFRIRVRKKGSEKSPKKIIEDTGN